MSVLTTKEILNIIPHRQPFMLIDTIEELEAGVKAVGKKCVSYNEPFFAGHFPEEPVMPGVLIIEALAQVGAVAILSMPENKGKIAYFGGIKEARFKGMVRPGDVLMLETEIIRMKGPVGIGYLPQEASVFRKMSVEDNILSVLEMTGKPREYQMEKLESLINDFDLQKVRKNLGDQLSGGERRRTEIARCLANDPKFIMLDEPFAGVDPIQVEEIQNIVWRLKYRNIGILITDHNVDETLAITDRAYLLFEGRILFQGSPEELAENKIVKEKYLTTGFVLRKKDFQLSDEQKRAEEGK